MLERFTDRARQVMVGAQREARTLGYDCVDTEHLLLALVQEGEGTAAKVLESLGADPEVMRQRVTATARHEARPSSGQLPFAPRAREVLRLAVRESVQLGHRYIGTEHLLLGLLREGDGAAARVLTSLGASLEEVRARVTQVLAEQRRKRWPRVMRC